MLNPDLCTCIWEASTVEMVSLHHTELREFGHKASRYLGVADHYINTSMTAGIRVHSTAVQYGFVWGSEV